MQKQDSNSNRTFMFHANYGNKNLNDKKIQKMMERLLNIQGECKIQDYEYLKLNLCKAIPLMILIILSFFGLFALKASIPFRKMVFYSPSTYSQADHLYIIGEDDTTQIVPINKKPQDEDQNQFQYRKLKYTLSDKENGIWTNKAIPKCFRIQQQTEQFLNSKYFKEGLNQDQVKMMREQFGPNQHVVHIQNYFMYLFDVLTAPFFILQYFFCIIYILQDLQLFAIVLIAFTLLTTTINYIMLYLSFKKVKQMSERNLIVKVIRNGKQVEIKDTELVPGDVYIPEGDIPADSIVLQGDLYVNQSNLTGESIPIGKFQIQKTQGIYENDIWLYDGSKIMEKKPNTLALVVNTGFSTIRGQIIRKIINRKVKTPDVVKSALVFVIEVGIIAVIVYFGTFHIILTISNDVSYIIFESLDYITTMAPIPIYFNLAYSLAIRRLASKNISGTEPEKTVFGAQVKTFCFDKTGTLTENSVALYEIYKLSAKSFEGIKHKLVEDNLLVKKLFAACHTVQISDGEVYGDQIDKQMFAFTEAKLQNSAQQGIIKKINLDNDVKLNILRINQFSSEYKGMSVLVQQQESKQCYIFVKGAPQKIEKYSNEIYPHYLQKVRDLSLRGYRTIGMGFKQISPKDIKKYHELSRQEFQKSINNLGIIAFENNLKKSTKQTITDLEYCGIQPKIITGDNIFIAVQTARRAAIISDKENVIILQGSKQNLNSQRIQLKGIKVNSSNIQEQIIITENQYISQSYTFAVDLDFVKLNVPWQTDRIKVYARVTPEGKSIIVKNYRQYYQEEYLKRYDNCIKRILKIDKPMVAMCGDGANDLLALKEADLSIGLQKTDASYGSSFTIQSLEMVLDVIKEGKASSDNIIHIVQFYLGCYFVIYLGLIWLNVDATYLSSAQLIFMDFGSFLFVPFFIAFAGPAQQNTDTTPDINFMTIFNHVIVWGNIIIFYSGMVGAYLFFYLSDQYVPNQTPFITTDSGFHPYNHSMTLIFLLCILVIPPFTFAFYRGSPWRKRIYHNIVLTIFITINFVIAVVFTLMTASIAQAFQMKPISIQKAAICLGIILSGAFIAIPFNIGIKSLKWHQKSLKTSK